MPAIPTRVCLLLVAACLAGGCASAEDWSAPRSEPVAVGTLGPGFVDPEHPPAPEATIEPRPGSWDGVRPPEGYRVVLLTSGEDAPTRTLVRAVSTWAEQVDASLKTVTAAHPERYVDGITQAMALRPDLIICAGDRLVDALSLVTPSHLAQQFLVIGAELPEPTVNVTAADWRGASFRGEGLPTASAYDPATFTGERAGRAVRAGVAAVLHGVTGIVIRLD